MPLTMTRTAQTPTVAYGTPPRVNLLPPVERERRALARLQRRLILIVLAVLAVTALAVVVAVGTRVQAQMSLDDANDQKTELQGQLASYADVSAMVSERDNLVTKRAEALADDMHWSKPFLLLSPALPSGAKLTGFTAGTGGPPTGKEGEIGLKGQATVESPKPIDQATVLDSFAQVKHVIDVDMLALQKGEGIYTYTVYVAFDQGLYNKRFQTKGGDQ